MGKPPIPSRPKKPLYFMGRQKNRVWNLLLKPQNSGLLRKIEWLIRRKSNKPRS